MLGRSWRRGMWCDVCGMDPSPPPPPLEGVCVCMCGVLCVLCFVVMSMCRTCRACCCSLCSCVCFSEFVASVQPELFWPFWNQALRSEGGSGPGNGTLSRSFDFNHEVEASGLLSPMSSSVRVVSCVSPCLAFGRRWRTQKCARGHTTVAE